MQNCSLRSLDVALLLDALFPLHPINSSLQISSGWECVTRVVTRLNSELLMRGPI